VNQGLNRAVVCDRLLCEACIHLTGLTSEMVTLHRGHINCCTHPSVRPSVLCLRFSRNSKAVEISNLVDTCIYLLQSEMSSTLRRWSSALLCCCTVWTHVAFERFLYSVWDWNSLPRLLRDTSHNTTSFWSFFQDIFVSQITSACTVEHIRGFGDYALYKSMFYLLTNTPLPSSNSNWPHLSYGLVRSKREYCHNCSLVVVLCSFL